MTPAARTVTAAASIAVAPLLDGPLRRAQRLGAFPTVVYLDCGEGALPRVLAVCSGGVILPNAVTVAVPTALAEIAVAERVTVGGRGLSAGTVRLRVTRWFDPRPRLPPTTALLLADRLGIATACESAAIPGMRPAIPGMRPAIAGLTATIQGGDATGAAGAAEQLLGAGEGLTPAGDDVLAGLLAALRLLPAAVPQADGRRVAALANALAACIIATTPTRTTALSATLLLHAARGEVAAPVAGLLQALAGRGDVAAAVSRLSAVGHTSGAALTAGVVAGAQAVLATAGAGLRQQDAA